MRPPQVVLFDVQQRTAVAELSTPFIKYAVWSGDMGHVALLSKHAIIIANKRLGQASTGARACHGMQLQCLHGAQPLGVPATLPTKSTLASCLTHGACLTTCAVSREYIGKGAVM